MKQKVLIIVLIFFPFFLYGSTVNDCMECHGEKGMGSAFVDLSEFKKSVHGKIICSDCHEGIKALPHEEKLPEVRCERCHSEVFKEYEKSIHGKKKDGERNAKCADCHGSHYIKPSSEPESPINHFKIPYTCGKCHDDPKLVEERKIPVKEPLKQYLSSIHGRLLLEEKIEEAPNCVSCHGSHSIYPANDPASNINRKNIPSTCGGCHSDAYKEYMESVHGTSFVKGAIDAPVCSSCHGEHRILPPEEKESTVSPLNVSKTCSDCHASERIIKKYGLPPNVVSSYEDSYHGLAYKFGDTRAANCASCHGHHLILPSSDPRSSIHPQNLKNTCGRCHPGASENFAKGRIHPVITKGKKEISDLVIYYVRLFYFIIIPLVIGGMFFHNLIDFIYRLREKYKEQKEKGGFLRLTIAERIQHFLLLITFFTLAFSGFALKFKLAIPYFEGPCQEEVRRWIHRSAAIIFVLVSVYHTYYLLFTKRGREWLFDMIPNLKDISDLIYAFLHYFGLRKEPPPFGRFSYIEKAEYLALIWGSVIMIVTGIILWAETIVLKYLPYWVINLSTLIHYYEAILATLAIFVWHLYHVLIKPGAKEANIAFITGLLSEKEMEEEHPLELKKLKEKGSSSE
jgi:formate dehydrogenase gamma subunit